MSIRLLSVICYLLLVGAAHAAEPTLEARYFTTYAYQDVKDPDVWIIPIRAWIYERPAAAVARWGAELAKYPHQAPGLRKFTKDLLTAKGVQGSRASITFDGVPSRQYIVEDANGVAESTDTGEIAGHIKLSGPIAEQLLKAQGETAWLRFRGNLQPETEQTWIRLIGDKGVSIISDIDDTIKITDVPHTLPIIPAKNTFVCDYVAVPGMAERYGQWKDAAFHYVSGGFQQMDRPVADFVQSAGYPRGSIHLRLPKVNLVRLGWRDLLALFSLLKNNPEAIELHKISRITEIMKRFPSREFILVGDSGERDPEIYAKIKKDMEVGKQVTRIIIRDIAQNAKQRLADITDVEIIPATRGREALCDDGVQRKR